MLNGLMTARLPWSLRWTTAFLFLSAVGVPQQATAELTTITGFSFLNNHPTLGNVGLNSPGQAMTDMGSLGNALVDLKMSFVGYATLADTLTIEDTILDFGGGNLITFELGPATRDPEILTPIIRGGVSAEITGATTTISGLDVSKFIGGSFAFTYQNAQISPGLTQGGNSGRLTLGALASASFTFRVPEPGSICCSLVGLVGLMGYGWRRTRTFAR